MLHRTCLISLASIAAFYIASPPARAEQTTSQQVVNQTSAIVGDYNTVNQYNIQLNLQKKNQLKQLQGLDLGQQNVFQGVNQTSGIVGSGNQVLQTGQQVNVQQKLLLKLDKDHVKANKQKKHRNKKHLTEWEKD